MSSVAGVEDRRFPTPAQVSCPGILLRSGSSWRNQRPRSRPIREGEVRGPAIGERAADRRAPVACLLAAAALALVLLCQGSPARALQIGSLSPPERPASASPAGGEVQVHLLSLPTFDPRDQQPYRVLATAYPAAEAALNHDQFQGARFMVFAPSKSDAVLAERAARFLLLLYNEVHRRLTIDHPAGQPLHVWLDAGAQPGGEADAGGQQFRDQVYIYRIYSSRTPLEWGRELAHEYGHYILPGVAGFSAPEEWANGVLGERLFISWLARDLRKGALAATSLPVMTPQDVRTYLERQVYPLLARYTARGRPFAPPTLKRRNAAGMDTYTGLALFVDAAYGSGALLDCLAATETAPGREIVYAPDFLKGVLRGLAEAPSLSIRPPLPYKAGATAGFYVYIPAGGWSASAPGTSWTLLAGGSRWSGGSERIRLAHSGWYKVSLSSHSGQPALTLRR